MSSRLRASGIREIFDRARALAAQGRSIVHLEIGRPHADSPDEAKRAATAALDAGKVHYTPNRGIEPLREAIAESSRRFGLEYDPMTEIVVTAGGSEAVYAAMVAAFEPGDEVVVLDPAWPHYAEQLRLAGMVPVHVPCSPASGFVPDPERVAAALGGGTRGLIVSSPSNPTGAVLAEADLLELSQIAIDQDLVVISDEIYDHFTYDGDTHVSIARLPGMRERTIVTNSFSKSYSMTGWRVGWAAAPSALADSINIVHQYLTVCAPSFAQAGALAALREVPEFPLALASEYGERRSELVQGLEEVAALDLPPLAGAFYAFPRLEGESDARPVALALLEQVGVAVVPGEVFGDSFGAHLRISYSVSREELAEGIARLRQFFQDFVPAGLPTR